MIQDESEAGVSTGRLSPMSRMVISLHRGFSQEAVMGKEKRGGGLFTTFVLALMIVVFSAAIGVGLANYGYRLPVVGLLFERPAQTTTSPVVVEGIQDLNQLATARATQSVIVTRESGGGRIERFLVGERVLLVAVGEVEAGVNLEDLSRDDVRVEGETVTIRLPEPELLSSSLDEERTRLYDRDRGILNLRSDDALVQEARIEAERRIREEAERSGLLDRAESNAETSIRAFALSLGFERVRFT
jgi:hypothetical protein